MAAGIRTLQRNAINKMLDLNRDGASDDSKNWNDPWKILVVATRSSRLRHHLDAAPRRGAAEARHHAAPAARLGARADRRRATAIYFVQPTAANVKRLGQDCARALAATERRQLHAGGAAAAARGARDGDARVGVGEPGVEGGRPVPQLCEPRGGPVHADAAARVRDAAGRRRRRRRGGGRRDRRRALLGARHDGRRANRATRAAGRRRRWPSEAQGASARPAQVALAGASSPSRTRRASGRSSCSSTAPPTSARWCSTAGRTARSATTCSACASTG